MNKFCLFLTTAALTAFCDGLYGKNPAATAAAEATPEYTVLENPTVDLASFPKDKEGWYVIFDGTTLDGWRGYGKHYVPSKWRVENGMIRLDGKMPGGEGGDLIFACKFGNFELELEWMISERGNSGILYLGREVATTREGRQVIEPLYISCPEYQVFDNASYPGAAPKYLAASLYDMIPAVPQNARPHGEWNKAKIRVYKGAVVHVQNDRNVVEYNLWTPQWTEMLEKSKFSRQERPLAFELLDDCGGPRREGYIGFQDHGDDVWYRNIRVRVLE